MPSKVVINIVGQDDVSAKLAAIRSQFDTLSTSKGWQSVMMGMGVGVGMAAFHAVETGIRDVVNIIPDLIGKGQAFAETVHTLTEATGANAVQASHLAGTFEFLGKDTDGMIMKFGVLAKYIVNHADAMHAAGIATTDASGVTLNMASIIDNARSVLSKYSGGVEQANAAVKMFGRAGLDMIEYLSLSDRQVGSLNAEMDKLGVTMDDSGVLKAKELSQSFNLMGLSVQGVANKLLNDIAPALNSAVDAFASFVSDHGRQIAQFAADVANFVIGMVSAITGASLSANTFTGSLAALGTVGLTPAQTKIASMKTELALLDSQQKTTTGGTGGLTNAMKGQTDAIDKQLASLKALGTEQDKALTKQMASLGSQVTAQLDAMTSAADAQQLLERRVGMTKELADAQKALAAAQAGTKDSAGVVTVDLSAVEAAKGRIADLTQQQVDMEQGVKDDARRAELGKVTAFLDALVTAEKDATDKKKLLTQEKAQASVLASQIATAKEKGDLQAVSDLTLMLSGIQAVERRTQQAIKEGAEQTELEKKKALLAAETAAVGGAVADQAAIYRAGLVQRIKDAEDQEKRDVAARKAEQARWIALGRDMDKVLGDNPFGAVGLFTAATAEGVKFGESMKGVFKGIADAMKGMLDGLRWIVDNIDKIGLGFRYLTDPKFHQEVYDIQHPPVLPARPSGTPPGWTYNVDSATGTGVWGPPRASGGPVSAGNPYLVGERGPELFVPGSSGSIVPNGGLGGNIVNIGPINVTESSDPETTARTVLQALKREVSRQGMTL
jgi:hypothetical protein